MEFIISEAVADDISEISLIENSCFSAPWSDDALLSSINSDIIRSYKVTDINGNICAFIFFSVVEDTAELINIAVSNSYRRKRLAERLMNTMLDELKKLSVVSVFLEVRESNFAAIGLYFKCGFEPFATRKNYYRNPSENAILMKKDIIQEEEK